MKLFPIVAITFFALCACNEAKNETENFAYTIDLDSAEEVKSISFSEFFDQPQTIILETKENSLITYIDELIADKDRLYVFDRRNASVLEFDTTGRFIRRFGNKGSAPGEYIDVRNFAVDVQRRDLWILDYMQQMLLRYDLDSGAFEKEFRFATKRREPRDGVTIIGDQIYASVKYRAAQEEQYMLKSLDIDNPDTETGAYLDRNVYLQGFDNYTMSGIGNFIYDGRNEYALYTNRLINQIFKIGPAGVENYIYIDSDKILNSSDRAEIAKAYNSPVFQAEPLLMMERYYGINEYFETDNLICFYINIGTSTDFFVYDRESGKVTTGFYGNDLLFKEIQSNVVFYTPLVHANRDGVYYQVRSDHVAKLKLAADDGLLADGFDNAEALKNVPDDANPILLFYRFKK